MRRSALVPTSIIFCALMGFSSSALAEIQDIGEENTQSRFGAGVEALLVAPTFGGFLPGGNLALSWDTGAFRLDGLVGMAFQEDAATTFSLGGRFMYGVHRSRNADFSLGGGLALGVVDPDGPADTAVRISLEGGFQLRVFLAANVALSATGGLGFSFGDGSFALGITGQLLGGLGVIYYF